MITREMIIEKLQNRGYKAIAQSSIKNGVEFEGICIKTESPISPIIYTEDIIRQAEEEGKSIDDVVEHIIEIYENNKTFDFDINNFFDKDFVLNHLYIGLQKVSTEELVKRYCTELDGIESYLYIRGEEGSYSVKLTTQLLEKAGLTEVEAWKKAEANTFAETTLVSMVKFLCEMMHMEYCEEMEEKTPFFVLTNKSKFNGASAILDRKTLENFGKRYHTKKIIAIPSSIHEFLISTYTEELNLDDLSAMVNEVNFSQVDEKEQLGSKAYIITL